MRHIGRLTGLALVIALGGGLNAAAEAQQQNGMGMQDSGQGMGMPGMMGQGMSMMGQGMGMQGMSQADMAERFGEADADGDGKVSRDEMVAQMTARATAQTETRADRMIAQHDGDGDGMLTLEELRAAPAGRMFERLDADGDGAVTREEFAKMREMMRHGKGGAGYRGAHHGDCMGMGMGHGGMGYGGMGHGGMGHGGMGHGGMGHGGVVIHQHYYPGN